MRSAALVVCLLLCSTLADAIPSTKWDKSNFKALTQKIKAALDQNDDSILTALWTAWKLEHGKANDAGIDNRFPQFKKNLGEIVAINDKNAQTGANWFAGPNALAHLSPAEFAAGYLGLDPSLKDSLEPTQPAAQATQAVGKRKLLGGRSLTQAPPAVVDWVAAGKTTAIKDQGGCGSCWAFAVVGAMESKVLIVNQTTLDLSEQQLVDCDKYDSGCNGGWPSNAYSYISSIAGLTSESNYPYTARKSRCNSRSIRSPLYKTVSPGYTQVTANSKSALITAVAAQPVTIAFTVESSFQYYVGGIFSSATCGTTVNHAMVVVGYDTNQGTWTLRNSWGTGWGEAGYVQVAMSDDGPGMCGMYGNGGWAPTLVTTPATLLSMLLGK